jgi:hypothetical protein
MEPWILFGLIFGGVLLLVALRRLLDRLEVAQRVRRYEAVPSLYTKSELIFHEVLQEAVGDEVVLMGKVRLADIITVKKEGDGSAWRSAFNRIQSKHLDYVACDPETYAIEFVVELDDRSHERKDRQERDAFVEGALDYAGVPLYRFPVEESYSVKKIRKQIFQ